MNILYLTDPYPDYLADQIYTGLCRVLVPKSVVDYPSKGIYHDPAQKVWYLPQVQGNVHSEQDIMGLLKERHFDMICLSSPRDRSLQILELIASRGYLAPVVIIDGEDDARIRYWIAERYHARLYFKREYIWVNGKLTRRWKDLNNYFRSFYLNQTGLKRMIFPLPFSIILDSVPKDDALEKEIDVSFRGIVSSRTSRKRTKVIELLNSMEGINIKGHLYTNKDSSNYLSPEEYYQEIRRSKIAISIRGGGFDTYRFWEILACRSLLLSELPDILIPNEFQHGEHIIYCKPDLTGLQKLIRYYLDHNQERERIAEQGYQHLLKYHTCEKRAEYFLEVCRAVL